MLPLREVLDKSDSGIWASEDAVDGISILRSTNIASDGSIDFANLAIKNVPARDREAKRLCPGDILLEKSGGGPKQPVGRVAYFAGDVRPHVFGNFIARLRPRPHLCEPRYLFWFLRHMHSTGLTEKFQKQTTGIRNLETRRFFDLPIPLPPLEEQRRIVAVLDRAASISRRADTARQQARALIPAIFLDLFGDPATNPKGWPKRALGSLLDRIDGGWSPVCGDGAPERDEWGVLKLSSVKSSGFFGDEAKRLREGIVPREDLEVSDGDLLFSRKNTLDLVGTAAVADHSGRRRMLPDTIFRLVVGKPAQFHPLYVRSLINLPSFRPTIQQLASGSASSMPGISKGRLSALEIPLPPFQQQIAFADQAARLESFARGLDGAATKAEALAGSLSAQVFG